MNLEITRPSDDELYSVSVGYGAGTRPGVNRAQLSNWLQQMGASKKTIEQVLQLEPHQSITIEISDDAWHGWAAAS